MLLLLQNDVGTTHESTTLSPERSTQGHGCLMGTTARTSSAQHTIATMDACTAAIAMAIGAAVVLA